MKTYKKQLHNLMAIFLLIPFIIIASISYAAIPQKINYQGYLTDPQGTAIDGTESMVFSIYSQVSGGAALWTETQTVTVTGGVFSVNLGNVNSIDLPFDTQYYLGIAVGTDNEMTPRQALTSVGYAFRAKGADSVKDNAVTTKVIANDAVTTDKVVDDAISGDKIAPAAVTSTNIANGAVGSSQIGDGSIATGDLADDAVTAAKIKPAIISSIDGVSNDGGNVDLVAGANITITPDDATDKITIASTGTGGSGDITAVHAGQGLSGGGDSGDVNLWIDTPFSLSHDTSASGSVISGTNNEGTGVFGDSYTGTGIKGESSSGTGVYGKHRASGNYGNLGTQYSGIYGYSTNDHGVWGSSQHGNGVYGFSGDEDGVYGETVTGYAIHGKSSNAATGVYGESSSGTGVYGWSDSDTGVYGLNSSGSNYGSLGSSTSGVYGYHGQTGNYGSIGGEYGGVHGESTSGWAVYGISNDGRGVYGSSVSSRGVYGKSRYDHGVYGESDSGNGVHGTTIGSGNGVYGTSTSGSGVYGYGPNGIGVYGTGLSSGVSGISSTGIGVYGQTSDDMSNGVEGLNTYYGSMGALGGVNGGVYGSGSTYAGYFSGNVHVSGTFSKSLGSFKIDHPLDPENKYLQHSFVESPDMMNVYNGNVSLDKQGEAWVELPEWFEVLNREFRYQLTCIGGFAPVYIAEKITDNRFKIAGGNPEMEVSWQVTGVRQDPYAKAHPIKVEELKPPEEQGYYLHPDVYGQPEEKSIEWARDPEMMQKRKTQKKTETQSSS